MVEVAVQLCKYNKNHEIVQFKCMKIDIWSISHFFKKKLMKSYFLLDPFMFKDSEGAHWVQMHLQSPGHHWSTLCRVLAKLPASPLWSSLEHQFALASFGAPSQHAHIPVHHRIPALPPRPTPMRVSRPTTSFPHALTISYHIPPNCGFAHCFPANSRWSIHFWGVNEFGRQLTQKLYIAYYY